MEVAEVSLQCQGHMHLHCAGCGCPVCHNVCDVCHVKCRAIFTVPDHVTVHPDLRGKEACARCYKAITIQVPRGQGCERCGGPKGYRNANEPAGYYLCIDCRVAEGTLTQLW